MNKSISTASAGLLTILASLVTVSARSQLPSSQPQPTTSPQSTPSLPTGSNIIGKFQCGSKATATGEISLRANGYYTAKDENGKYQAIDQGYRFLSSALRGQSLIKYRKNMYLIDTKDEAKASAVIANNSSTETLSCSSINRNY
jgi:hypothetical protein